jgi:hypothetical protein
MSALRRRLEDESGHTMPELVVTMALGVLMLGVVLLIAEMFTNSSGANNRLTQIEDDSRSVMADVVRTIRDAPQPATSTSPIAIARSHDVVIAGRSNSGNVWIRYCVGGGALVMGTTPRTTAMPADPGVTCPTSSGGVWSYGQIVPTGVLNATQLFTYACTSSCSSAGAVRSVSVRLDRAVTSTRSVVLTSAVSPRNLP